MTNNLTMSSVVKNFSGVTFVVHMEPASRKAWMENALAELRGRRGLSYAAIARAMGKSRQNAYEAIMRDAPSEHTIEELRKAFPYLPDPHERAGQEQGPEPTSSGQVLDAIDRLEHAVTALLAGQTMLMERVERLLKKYHPNG